MERSVPCAILEKAPAQKKRPLPEGGKPNLQGIKRSHKKYCLNPTFGRYMAMVGERKVRFVPEKRISWQSGASQVVRGGGI
jgi:hypothetical protein